MSNQNPYTEDENKINGLIVQAHNTFVGLEKTHPGEYQEWVDGIHKLQYVLSMRVLRRDYPNTFPTVKP